MGDQKTTARPATVFAIDETSGYSRQGGVMKPTEHCRKGDTLATGHMKQLGMVSRKISPTGKEFGYRAIYDTGVMWTIMFRPVDDASGSLETWGYISMPAKHKGDTVIEECLLQDMAALIPGCKRLSYYDSKPHCPKDICSATADDESYSMIVFKGRYDAELN
jgi:hypothetical protein